MNLNVQQLRAAVERAEQRVQAARPGDEKQARQWVAAFRKRLERAMTEGRA